MSILETFHLTKPDNVSGNVKKLEGILCYYAFIPFEYQRQVHSIVFR